MRVSTDTLIFYSPNYNLEFSSQYPKLLFIWRGTNLLNGNRIVVLYFCRQYFYPFAISQARFYTTLK